MRICLFAEEFLKARLQVPRRNRRPKVVCRIARACLAQWLANGANAAYPQFPKGMGEAIRDRFVDAVVPAAYKCRVPTFHAGAEPRATFNEGGGSCERDGGGWERDLEACKLRREA